MYDLEFFYSFYICLQIARETAYPKEDNHCVEGGDLENHEDYINKVIWRLNYIFCKI